MKPLNNAKNYIGLKFGRLTVIDYAGRHSTTNITLWKCSCSCGGTKIVSSSNLRAGYTKSCGCRIHEPRRVVHGGCFNYKEEPIYKIWRSIKSRCYRKDHPSYRNYGGRGIRLIDVWKTDYTAFKTYIINTLGSPEKGHILDRINSEGNYEPGNLRWATRLKQNLNRGKLRTRKCTSKYKGVSFSKQHHKWVAQIGWNYKNINLGLYLIESEAAEAYNKAALRYFGKEAKLNII